MCVGCQAFCVRVFVCLSDLDFIHNAKTPANYPLRVEPHANGQSRRPINRNANISTGEINMRGFLLITHYLVWQCVNILHKSVTLIYTSVQKADV